MDPGRTRLHVALALISILAASSLGVVGCSQDAAAPSAADLAAAQKLGAEKIADERCSSCHSAFRSLAWRTSSRSEAKRLVDSMVKLGASPTEDEQEKLIEYFLR